MSVLQLEKCIVAAKECLGLKDEDKLPTNIRLPFAHRKDLSSYLHCLIPQFATPWEFTWDAKSYTFGTFNLDYFRGYSQLIIFAPERLGQYYAGVLK